MDFLQLLRDDVRDGLNRAPAGYREKHMRWIAAQEHSGGGFKNRRGNAELYYTTFALRSLAALNGLTPEIAQRAATFLLRLRNERGGAFGDAVSAASWWDSLSLCEEIIGPRLAQPERIELTRLTHARLGFLQRDDGGWAKTALEGNGSLYHTFLVACTYLRMGEPLPAPDKLRGFLKCLEQSGGGFLENKYSKRPGTNGTAAGVGLSLLLAASTAAGRFASWTGLAEKLLPLATRDLACHATFVKSMRGGEGGFYATPNAPITDLLSTYTGLFTLKMLGQSDQKITTRAVAYARSLEDEEGGYAGFELESILDCEYTFYGLGLESIAHAQPQ